MGALRSDFLERWRGAERFVRRGDVGVFFPPTVAGQVFQRSVVPFGATGILQTLAAVEPDEASVCILLVGMALDPFFEPAIRFHEATFLIRQESEVEAWRGQGGVELNGFFKERSRFLISLRQQKRVRQVGQEHGIVWSPLRRSSEQTNGGRESPVLQEVGSARPECLRLIGSVFRVGAESIATGWAEARRDGLELFYTANLTHETARGITVPESERVSEFVHDDAVQTRACLRHRTCEPGATYQHDTGFCASQAERRCWGDSRRLSEEELFVEEANQARCRVGKTGQEKTVQKQGGIPALERRFEPIIFRGLGCREYCYGAAKRLL